MYLARFSGDGSDFVTAALKWPAQPAELLPASWSEQFIANSPFEFSIRVTAGSGPGDVLMMINSHVQSVPHLEHFCKNLLEKNTPSGLSIPLNADDFDRIAGGLPQRQIQINYHGYQHSEKPLACNFRLYPMLLGQTPTLPSAYQIHFKPHHPDKELERRVRKYSARLEIEKPFTGLVRDMQQLLARQLLQPGAIAREHLLLDNQNDLDFWLGRINDLFKETTGRIGFSEPPVEIGDFNDWLVTGRHPSTDEHEAENIPAEGAAMFDEKELLFFLHGRCPFLPGGDITTNASAKQPEVFISYSSADYTFASSICSQLEQAGISCWIAPRDINRDILPYPEAITRAIAKARAIVVILSETANLSVHIPRELNLAIGRKLSIVPVRLQKITPAGQLLYFLETCQWLDAFDRSLTETVEELRMRLR